MPVRSVATLNPTVTLPRLILIGPPAAGKGTLASRLTSLNLDHVSPGDFFRAEVARQTNAGRALKASLASGHFVSDAITLRVTRKWFFGRTKSQGFLLDGFPRNLLQAKVLDDWLDQRREPLTACLWLDLRPEDSIRRMVGRRVCPADGSVYHLSFRPPAGEGKCDLCGAVLVQRDDDRESTVLHRWSLFRKHTLPVIKHYRDQGLLIRFDASLPMDRLSGEVMQSVRDLL